MTDLPEPGDLTPLSPAVMNWEKKPARTTVPPACPYCAEKHQAMLQAMRDRDHHQARADRLEQKHAHCKYADPSANDEFLEAP